MKIRNVNLKPGEILCVKVNGLVAAELEVEKSDYENERDNLVVHPLRWFDRYVTPEGGLIYRQQVGSSARVSMTYPGDKINQVIVVGEEGS